MKDRIVVHAGGVIRIIAYVSGKPPPTISWSRDDRALPPEATIEETAISSSMVIKNCKRSHQGVYTLLAKNAGGERKKTIIVDVLGKPQDLNIYDKHGCQCQQQDNYKQTNKNHNLTQWRYVTSQKNPEMMSCLSRNDKETLWFFPRSYMCHCHMSLPSQLPLLTAPEWQLKGE